MQIHKSLAKLLLCSIIISFVIAPIAQAHAQENNNQKQPSNISSSKENDLQPKTPQADPLIANKNDVHKDEVVPDKASLPQLDEKNLENDNVKKPLSEESNEKSDKDKKDSEKDKNLENSLAAKTEEVASQKSKNISAVNSSQLIVLGNSGQVNYEYPINTPPGRLGIEPNLSLMYNQNSQDGMVLGQGWSFNIPHIKRISKTGSQNLYAGNIFESSLDGELTNVAGSVYGAKFDDGDFRNYEFQNNIWIVKDKQGLIYKFGLSSQGRQANPANSNQVFSWYLEEIKDLNGNYISYKYFTDGQQLYPEFIIYTNFGAETGIFKVEFLRESRSVVTKTFKTGYEVNTNFRINKINIYVENRITKNINLGYNVGDNAKKDLLQSIQETAYSEAGEVSTQPATNFTYNKSILTNGYWNEYDFNFQLPPVPFSEYLYSKGNLDNSVRFGYINKDGLIDMVFGEPNNYGVYINNGNGTWSGNLASNYNFVESFTNGSGTDWGRQLIDMNGDDLDDLVVSTDLTKKVYLNDGSKFILQNNDWSSKLPRFFVQESYKYSPQPVRLQDINGDNLPDFVEAGIYNRLVYLNNGNGSWTDVSSTWTIQESFVDNYGKDKGIQIFDINNDGLVDWIKSFASDKRVVFNSGKGWTHEFSSWSVNLPLDFSDPNTKQIDINNDGLTDLIYSQEYTTPMVFLNLGDGKWSSDVNSSWKIPLPFNVNGDFGVRIIDINGDGYLDFVQHVKERYNTRKFVYLGKGLYPDHLAEVKNHYGGSQKIEYKNSPKFVDSNNASLNPSLTEPLVLVSKISTNDGFGQIADINHTYFGGEYFYDSLKPSERRLSGFNIVQSASDSKIIKEYYHQGNSSLSSNEEYNDHESKIGKLYKQETYNLENKLFSKMFYLWANNLTSPNRHFTFADYNVALEYNGDANHKDKATKYSYNLQNGNVIKIENLNEVNATTISAIVDVGSDKITNNLEYSSNSNNPVVSLASRSEIVDQNNQKLSEAKTYYDGLEFGQADKGNVTKTENWIAGSQYALTENTYNNYGLVTSTKDANSNSTSYIPDAKNLYPNQTINALGYVTVQEYNLSIGQPKKIVSAAGLVSEVQFDGFGRIVKESRSNLSNNALITTKEFQYQWTSPGFAITEKLYNSSTSEKTSVSYFNGANQLIQTKIETPNSNSFVTTDLAYNTNGLLEKKTFPYLSSSISKSSFSSNLNLIETTTYDSLNRITSQKNSVGETKYLYSDWAKTIINPNGKFKNFRYDASGNLILVEENNNNQVYATNYKYNGLGDLIKITDALGNVRNFYYNGLSNRIFAEDLHDPNDSTYGDWNYVYDSNQNLLQVRNPNGDIINFGYDKLNRKITEDYAGSSGVEVSFQYDSCSFSKNLNVNCSATSQGYSENNQFNILGMLIEQTKNIEGLAYNQKFEYSEHGLLTSITNPDSSIIQYDYDGIGSIKKILNKEASVNDAQVIIQNVIYHPSGQIQELTFGNNAKLTNLFDSEKLYRLKNKKTETQTQSGPTILQDISYQYDSNGNITKILDSSQNNSAKTIDFAYDDLDRLISAQSSQVAFGQNFNLNYQYNAIGNIIYSSDKGEYQYLGNTGDNYANPHAVTQVGSTVINYDKNGNLTQFGSKSYDWDYNNRLLKVQGEGLTEEYKYNFSTQRVKKINGSNISVYPFESYDVENGNSNKNISLLGQNIASASRLNDVTNYYFNHNDHLGGTNLVTKLNGEVSQIVDYLPYGGIRLDEKIDGKDESKKFTGHEYDAGTGLNYMNARYYDPAIGRFLSQDPAFWNSKYELSQLFDPQSWNSYSYARNNPLAFIDPDGNMWTPWQSSGGFGNWMGNGGFLHNIYGSSANSINNTIGSIQQAGWTKTNVKALGADAASIIAKTSGVVLVGVGLGMGAGVATNVLTPAAVSTSGTVCASGGCDKAQRAATAAYNDAVSRTLTKYPNANLPDRADVIKNFDFWANTNFPSKTDSMLYHAAKHGELNSLTSNAHNVWNSYVSNQTGVVRDVLNYTLKNGEAGIRVRLNDGTGGIFNTSGKIISSWKK